MTRLAVLGGGKMGEALLAPVMVPVDQLMLDVDPIVSVPPLFTVPPARLRIVPPATCEATRPASPPG